MLERVLSTSIVNYVIILVNYKGVQIPLVMHL
jgi:hypothetical protein